MEERGIYNNNKNRFNNNNKKGHAFKIEFLDPVFIVFWNRISFKSLINYVLEVEVKDTYKDLTDFLVENNEKINKLNFGKIPALQFTQLADVARQSSSNIDTLLSDIDSAISGNVKEVLLSTDLVCELIGKEK